ncbi:hypothetical protein [Streptomyces sp. NPDC048639]|uniref:hypothetical protein n=1 Tax=Streptomyces sp. NPDC048639 TaxID=3365581 RepID=UPI00372152E9
MRPDCSYGTSGGELAVPMAWMYAEYIADELLRTGDLMPPTTFEFRAGRDALALTIFLSDTEGELSGIRVISQMEHWRSLTSHDQPWEEWVRERLAHLEQEDLGQDDPSPDLRLARDAWRWLDETELLAADLDAPGPWSDAGLDSCEEDAPKVWIPAWQLGLPLGHLAIHLF